VSFDLTKKEAQLFEAFGIPIYHAWLYDPTSEEYRAIMKYGGGSRDEFSSSVEAQELSGEIPDDFAIGLADEIAQDAGFSVTDLGLITLARNIVQDQYSIFYDGSEFVSPVSLLIPYST
jgi:hypothetical protein